ncbi:MAG: ABC-ATPase domain-containing protein [Clostridia bacterium]|nr:ABC-ATPase domain-containing protein [Clostridia bacterium]
METNTATYTEMYEGALAYLDPTRPNMPPIPDYNPIYYNGNVGFEITGSHKLAQDKPTVTVIIPHELLIWGTEGVMPLKRLKYYLHNMENDTVTYSEMYDGKRETVFPSTAWDGHCLEPEIENDPIYYHEDVSFSIELTHKLAKDKPTLTWNIPTERLGINTYTTAAADFCLREFKRQIDLLNDELYNRSRPDNENGKYYIHAPGGEVLKRNTAYFAICPQRDYEYASGSRVYMLPSDRMPPPTVCLCIRLQVQLPRRKLRRSIQMLCRDLPDAVDRFIGEFDHAGLCRALELAEKQSAIRRWLKSSDYCAFVANGSILPRSKGTDLPLENAVPFKSTAEDEIEVCGVRGMGVKKGVTVITGGGYSGKSTLLDAIAAGIYDHVYGDGRELCITDSTAVTVSAEDGRSVKHVNISPFIKWLPGGDTSDFSTQHASGSTSQAANIMEAVDFGAKLLLIDEDRSATNFMIRDKMMKELIEKEPITPFTDRVCELHASRGVSTILVIGGSGEYLSVADKVYMMEDYRVTDVTAKAKGICASYGVFGEAVPGANWNQKRILCSEHFSSYPHGSGSEKLTVSDLGFILIGDEVIDVRGLHDIVTPRQLDTLGFMLRYLEVTNKESLIDIEKKIDEMYLKIEKEGLDFLYSAFFTTCERFLDLPRKAEIMAVINRMRMIKIIRKEELA